MTTNPSGADSINASSLNTPPLPFLPDFFLGYVDGRWDDYRAIAAAHGNKPVFGLTVFGNPSLGQGTDSEPGNATIAQTVTSTKGELARGVERPIVYCPASWGASMVAAHTAAGIARTKYRLVLAHYGRGEHICGPGTCGYAQADATQWANYPSYDRTLGDTNFLTAADYPGLVAPASTTATYPQQKMLTGCVGLAATPDGKGYWEAQADGGVFTHGDSQFFGSEGGKPLNKPVVGIAADGCGGYWLAAADGGVFNFGAATFDGSETGKPLNAPVIAIAARPQGDGYWLVAADGGVFNFGAAGMHGSLGGKPLNKPVVGVASTPTGNGYWLVAGDGGVFNFGDASFDGSEASQPLNKPVVGIASNPAGHGYWLVASDGGVFCFGDVGFHGSFAGVHLNAAMAGITGTPTGQGYWLVAGDGGVFTGGDAAFEGSGQ